MSTYPLKVVKRRCETEDTVSLWFDVPPDLRTVFTYSTGQFITIEEDIDGATISRQYSLATVPTLDDRIQITVKRLPGGRMSTWLVDIVQEGDILEVASPRGRLYTPSEEPRHLLLLAAGSGIVPLQAIARDALSLNAGHRVTLAYGNRHEESIILRSEVDLLAEGGAVVEHVLSRPPELWAGRTGHVDPDFLEELWSEWAQGGQPTAVYLCGPDAFMAAAEADLILRGIDINDIRKESFDLVLNDDDTEPDLLVPDFGRYEEPEACMTLTAVLGGDEIEVTPEPGEALLSALLRVSDDVPFSCQEGTCSSCIVKLVEGCIGIRPGVLQTLRPADLDEGLILACLSRARTESVRIDFDNV
ncbi:ferredoxin--NADP reductase [soil metagenome]